MWLQVSSMVWLRVWAFSQLWGEERALGIENGHHWAMIQSKKLFDETSIRIHEWGIQKCWGGNTQQWCEVLWSLGHGASPHLHFHFALHYSHLSVPRFILHENLTFLREWSFWVWSSDYWVIEHGVGVMNFPVLDTSSNQEWLGITCLASELRTVPDLY